MKINCVSFEPKQDGSRITYFGPKWAIAGLGCNDKPSCLPCGRPDDEPGGLPCVRVGNETDV